MNGCQINCNISTNFVSKKDKILIVRKICKGKV